MDFFEGLVRIMKTFLTASNCHENVSFMERSHSSAHDTLWANGSGYDSVTELTVAIDFTGLIYRKFSLGCQIIKEKPKLCKELSRARLSNYLFWLSSTGA